MKLSKFFDRFRFASIMLQAWNYAGKSPGEWPLEQARKSMRLWFHEEVIKQYRPRDFLYLPEKQRENLDRAIQNFKEIVSIYHCAEFIDDETVSHGVAAFLEIYNILKDYIWGEELASAFTEIDKIISGHVDGELVKGVYLQLGEDATDEPAVWLWILVDEDATQLEDFQVRYRNIKRMIQNRFDDKGLPYCYVHLRTIGEQNKVLMGDIE